MGQAEAQLCGGAQPGQEHVLQVDKGCPEGAAEEVGHQGPGEDVASAAGELGEDVEGIEAGWEIPLAGGVPEVSASIW